MLIACSNIIYIYGSTVYPKKYAHGFCFAVLCCGYTLTDFPISIRLTSLALWQSNDCPSASKATLMNIDKYFMWIHYEQLHNHNKAKHNKTVCIFLGICCSGTCQSYPEIISNLVFANTEHKIKWLAESGDWDDCQTKHSEDESLWTQERKPFTPHVNHCPNTVSWLLDILPVFSTFYYE